jgi:hypothetical protein
MTTWLLRRTDTIVVTFESSSLARNENPAVDDGVNMGMDSQNSSYCRKSQWGLRVRAPFATK